MTRDTLHRFDTSDLPRLSGKLETGPVSTTITVQLTLIILMNMFDEDLMG